MNLSWLEVHTVDIASFLDPCDVVQLAGVNRHLQTVLGPLVSQLKFVFDYHTYDFRAFQSSRNVCVPRVWRNRPANWLDLCHVLHALPVHHFDRQCHAIHLHWWQAWPDFMDVIQRPRAPLLRYEGDLVLPFRASTFPYHVFFGQIFSRDDLVSVLALFVKTDFAGGDGSARAHGIFLLRSGMWVAASALLCEYPFQNERSWSTAPTLEDLALKQPSFFRALWHCTLFDLPPLPDEVLNACPETVSLSEHVLPDPEVLDKSILPRYKWEIVHNFLDAWDHHTNPAVVIIDGIMQNNLDFPDLSSWHHASVSGEVGEVDESQLPLSLEEMLAVQVLPRRSKEWRFYHRAADEDEEYLDEDEENGGEAGQFEDA
eukprot:TRINITY_DN1981_c0_g4_i1.p1 TRINITY_DN1981_c0_g4~~TRINITY_DN1981_c0_g4_i1.p1  ORF type:complete len:393 (+),score=92.15 TRINITY_DN1981_c0_g4_i1:66-1181(+)